MFRTLAVLTVAATLMGTLPVTPDLASPARPEFKVGFCPQCWEFITQEGATDSKGDCARCHKPPVFLMVGFRIWTWCAPHGGWHSRPCLDDAAKKCCEAHPSYALGRLWPTEEIFEARYCPSCRTFTERDRKTGSAGRCAACEKPRVWADAVARTWYWCVGDGVWYEEPCSMDRSGKCCIPRTGALLVVPTIISSEEGGIDRGVERGRGPSRPDDEGSLVRQGASKGE